jgi:hypothetical protein
MLLGQAAVQYGPLGPGGAEGGSGRVRGGGGPPAGEAEGAGGGLRLRSLLASLICRRKANSASRGSLARGPSTGKNASHPQRERVRSRTVKPREEA